MSERDPLEVRGRPGHDRPGVLGDELDGPVPPGRSQQALHILVVIAVPDHLRRVAAGDGVRRDV